MFLIWNSVAVDADTQADETVCNITIYQPEEEITRQARSEYTINTSITSRQDAIDVINAYAEENNIDPNEYSGELIWLLTKHPESMNFVLGYPINKGYAPAVDIREDIESANGGVPLFMQWDTRWGYKTYGSDCMGLTGCGPTCLSMVTVALTGDSHYDPAMVADYSMANGYYDYENNNGTYWTLMSEGCEDLGIKATELEAGEDILQQALSTGPVICSMGPGAFTTTGHFIVITGYNLDTATYTINDPNSVENSQKLWTYEEFGDQINNAWGYEAL